MPIPVARAAGTMPSSATSIIMSTGRNCARDPSMMASLSEVPGSARRRLISAINNTPLITATPNREMKPTAADTLRLMPRSYRKTMPPTSEKGTFISTSPA